MDDFEFPKKRDPGINIGGRKADTLLNLKDVDWLRKHRFGTTIIKRGSKIDFRQKPVALDNPYLWSTYELRFGGVVYRTGIQTAANAAQISKVKVWSYGVRDESQPYPFVEMPYWDATQLFVGDDYVIRRSLINGALYEDDPWWSGIFAHRAFCYLTNIRYRDPVVQSLSLLPGNVYPNDISFYDSGPLLDYDGGGIFATGWNPEIGAYCFGITGLRIPTDSASYNYRRLDCRRGDTYSRVLTESIIKQENEVDLAMHGDLYGDPYVTGQGRLFLLAMNINQRHYPENPMFAMVSTTHGHFWSQLELPELAAHQLRYFDDPSGQVQWNFWTAMPHQAVATFIGNGRIALVMLCAKEEARTYTWDEFMAADRFSSQLTCWKFFLSDETGTVFTNVPWPLDNEDGIRLSAIGGLGGHGSYPDWNGLHPAVEFAKNGLGGTPMTAGPGSFFMSVGVMEGKPPATDNTTPAFDYRLVKMLWTVDWGVTWTLSDYLPRDAMCTPVVNYGLGISSFSIAKVAVARPYHNDQDRGELYMQGVGELIAPGEAGNTWAQFVWRTDATFTTFTLVAVQYINDTTLIPAYGDAPPGYLPPPIYVGDKQNGSRHRPMLHPGYPEFDRP